MRVLKSRDYWRPRRDLNPCCRRERPMSWARLDDGDANGEPCWIRTSDPLLKSAQNRQTEYHTLLNLLGFSSHFSPQSNSHINRFGGSSRTKGGQSKDCCQRCFFGAGKTISLKPSILRTGFDNSIRVLFSKLLVVRVCAVIGSPLRSSPSTSQNVDCISCRCSYDDWSAYKTASLT